MRALMVAVLGVTAFAACRSRPAPGSVDALEPRARAILERHCGDCHLPSPSSPARSLAVFDLSRPGWHRSMSAAQRIKSVQMLGDRKTLTEAELAEFFWRRGQPPVVPSAEEEAEYGAFVDATLGEPAGAPVEAPQGVGAE